MAAEQSNNTQVAAQSLTQQQRAGRRDSLVGLERIRKIISPLTQRAAHRTETLPVALLGSIAGAMSDAIVELTARAYEIARAIPVGRVTSYGTLQGHKQKLTSGHIAKLAGYPAYSR